MKTRKFGGKFTKLYHEVPIEYKYIDKPNQLMQRLYFIYAEGKPVTTISITKKEAF